MDGSRVAGSGGICGLSSTHNVVLLVFFYSFYSSPGGHRCSSLSCSGFFQACTPAPTWEEASGPRRGEARTRLLAGAEHACAARMQLACAQAERATAET